MKFLALFLCIAFFSLGGRQETRFVTLEVFIDSQANKLAAWQLEVEDTEGRAQLVGIEGGDHPAYQDPPAYDPKALQGGKVILASFQLAEDLPQGRTRVARLSFAIEGPKEPVFVCTPIVAAQADGQEIPIQTEVRQ